MVAAKCGRHVWPPALAGRSHLQPEPAQLASRAWAAPVPPHALSRYKKRLQARLVRPLPPSSGSIERSIKPGTAAGRPASVRCPQHGHSTASQTGCSLAAHTLGPPPGRVCPNFCSHHTFRFSLPRALQASPQCRSSPTTGESPNNSHLPLRRCPTPSPSPAHWQ